MHFRRLNHCYARRRCRVALRVCPLGLEIRKEASHCSQIPQEQGSSRRSLDRFLRFRTLPFFVPPSRFQLTSFSLTGFLLSHKHIPLVFRRCRKTMDDPQCQLFHFNPNCCFDCIWYHGWWIDEISSSLQGLFVFLSSYMRYLSLSFVQWLLVVGLCIRLL